MEENRASALHNELSEIANQAAYRSKAFFRLRLLPARLIEKIAITT
jgi:hypothetical protein